MPARRRAAPSDDDDEVEVAQPKSRSKGGRKSSTSKNRGLRRDDRGDEDEEEEAEEEEEQEQAASTSKGKGKKGAGKGEGAGAKKPKKAPVEPLTEEEIDAKAYDLARYALMNEWTCRPLRRDDASKTVLGPGLSRQFPAVLDSASAKLAEIFGLEIVEMRARGANAGALAAEEEARQRDADDEPAPKKAKGPQSYVLRSVFDDELIAAAVEDVEIKIPKRKGNNGQRNNDAEEQVNEDDLDAAGRWAKDGNAALDWKRGDQLGQQGVLGVILALILANGRVMDDHQLRIYLRRLDIDATWDPPKTPATHNAAPNIDTLLTSFLRQGYLERDKTNTPGAATQGTQSSGRRRSGANKGTADEDGDNASQWRWGARAELEIGEAALANLMAQIYIDGDENENANATQARRGGKSDPKERLVVDIARAAGSALQNVKDYEGR